MNIRYSLCSLTIIVVVSCTGCLEGRSYFHSNSIAMVEPLQNDFVQAPLQVRWKSKFPRAERFAVLLDRSPLARGKSVDSLEVQERGNLWITESEELLIAFVPQRRTKVASRRDRHRIIVVPLDAKGRRRGDDLASVELTVVSQ